MVNNEKHPLTGALAAYVEQFDFARFGYATIDEILDAHRRTAFWAERFGGLLPQPKQGKAPAALMPHETAYVGKLLEVYAEAAGAEIAGVGDLDAHAEWKDHLQKQRVRFFDAEAFMATYRDQTEPGTTESFADQIYDAIEPSLTIAVASQAAPASVLAPQAKIGVKQGVCHQLANDDRVTWKI